MDALTRAVCPAQVQCINSMRQISSSLSSLQCRKFMFYGKALILRRLIVKRKQLLQELSGNAVRRYKAAAWECSSTPSRHVGIRRACRLGGSDERVLDNNADNRFEGEEKRRNGFAGVVPGRDDLSRSRQRVISRSVPVGAIGGLVAASSAVAASGTGSHAIMATVTQVAVTAAAVAYGAYLGENMINRDGGSQQRAPYFLEGVDVTDYAIFREPEVQAAVRFAREAHEGQMRKTGEHYVTHCIHTARILAALVPPKGKRAVDTVVAGVLHDVIDDTKRTLKDVKKSFGDDVAELVEGVSKLSHINQARHFLSRSFAAACGAAVLAGPIMPPSVLTQKTEKRISVAWQLLRRHRRRTAEATGTESGLSYSDVDKLRVMLLGMVNDPRVVLIKLADRLHNMRTIYALPQAKACAVAQETLAVWCSLASRLGVWAVKAELEDLAFAVLQPLTFRQLRAELAAMWSNPEEWRTMKRRSSASKRRGRRFLAHMQQAEEPEPVATRKDPEDEQDVSMKELLEAVVPFDVLLDRTRRNCALGSTSLTTSSTGGGGGSKGRKAKVVRDAEIALAALGACEEALDKELLITTPYVPGMEVTSSGRLKSLYSAHCKMRRKGVGLDKIYDARALRVVVGDRGGELHVAAVEGCYNLLSVIHSLWTPIGGEFDDYIVNPKSSGYQSLHTAVSGPDGAPVEIQIRTQYMHEYAEYGHAAHWLYKEADGPDLTVLAPSSLQQLVAATPVPSASATASAAAGAGAGAGAGGLQTMAEGAAGVGRLQTRLGDVSLEVRDPELTGAGAGAGADSSDDEGEEEEEVLGAGGGAAAAQEVGVREGHPALRIEDGRLLAAVVVRAESGGRELLVATSFALQGSEAVAAGRCGNQRQRWSTYARLYTKVAARWWNAPGHGDWSTCLEKYTLCSDNIYHKEDQFGRALPTFIQLLDLNAEEQAEYAQVMQLTKDGAADVLLDSPGPNDLQQQLEAEGDAAELAQDALPSTTSRLNNKVRLLRTMLQWEQELRHEAAADGSITTLHPQDSVALAEVLVIRWPGGDILRMPSGSAAADAARQAGLEGKMVLINGKVAMPSTKLRDGDFVEIR
eukprot:jgi/Mesen1/8018/ME000426S07172